MPPIASRFVRRVTLACAVIALAAPTLALGDDYVALGDSFSSGVGTGSYTLSRACLRSVHAYPYRVARQRPNTSLRFVACSGATTATVMSSQIRAVRSTTDIVTITIGGNDLGFAELAVQCTLGDCSSSLDARRASLPGSLNTKLDTVYAAIRARAAANARVVVLGYPRIFTKAVCPAAAGISLTERTKANQLADALDRTIRARALAHGFAFRSAIGPFQRHAVCSPSPWLNGLSFPNATESYHPNRAGNSQGYAPLVLSALG